jgi:DNA primase large subunit
VGKEKYGNLVKLPLGINLKTGVRSTFIDPDSSSSLPPFPGRLVLCEVSGNEYVPEPKSKSKSKKSKAARKSGKRLPVEKQLTPCMVWSLANSPLEGGEDNSMRHAIAAEAKFAGFTEPEIIALFEHLPDFKRDKTEKYVRNVMKVQNAPYSCQTLKEKCPNLTGNVDCGSCYKRMPA